MLSLLNFYSLNRLSYVNILSYGEEGSGDHGRRNDVLTRSSSFAEYKIHLKIVYRVLHSINLGN